MAKVSKTKSPTTKITGADMADRFAEFLADDTNINLARKVVQRLLRPEFIVELFVADFSERSQLISVKETAFYTRYVPVVKLLAVPDNLEPPMDSLKEGDICSVSDQLVSQAINPKWESWMEAKRTGGANLISKEPMRLIKGIYNWIDKYYFALDKAAMACDMESVEYLNKKIDKFEGPYIFKIPPMQLGVELNPEAVLEQFEEWE